MKLQNKTAIITGAAVGIGAASAALFAREGAQIVAVDIDRELLNQASSELEKAGASCLAVPADVSKRIDVEMVVRSATQKYGQIDILFNNAGIVPTGKLDVTSEKQWDRAMAINVKSMYLFCHAVIPGMKAQGGGVTSIRFCDRLTRGRRPRVLHIDKSGRDRPYKIDGARLRPRQDTSELHLPRNRRHTLVNRSPSSLL